MKKVNNEAYCNELRRIRKECGFGWGNEFGITLEDMGEKDVIKMGVNWGGCGTKDADTTKRFVEQIAKAAYEAEHFKYNGYVRVYGAE